MTDWLEATLAHERSRQRRAKPVLRESAQQQALIQIAHAHRKHRKYGIIHEMLHSIPNGADVAEHHRGRLVAEGLAAGYPDLALDIARGGYHGLRLEMKADALLRLRANQDGWRLRLERGGYYYFVGWDAGSAWARICDYVNGDIVRAL